MSKVTSESNTNLLLTKVAVIGGGVIGGGWVARFLMMGCDVTVFDPDPEAERKIAEVTAALEKKQQESSAETRSRCQSLPRIVRYLSRIMLTTQKDVITNGIQMVQHRLDDSTTILARRPPIVAEYRDASAKRNQSKIIWYAKVGIAPTLRGLL